MKSFSPKMLSVAALLTTTLLVQPALAEDNRDVVHDNNGHVVRSIVSGNCVRTKWEGGADECGTAAPAPQVAAPAPKQPKSSMQEQNRSYLVFFDFDKSSLTEDGKGIVRDVVSNNKSDGRIAFNVTAHADRSGTDAYNMKLSERRAQSVKNELVALGVNPDNISVAYKGESEPLVQTDDGIKEPQNRRAEIRVVVEVMEKR